MCSATVCRYCVSYKCESSLGLGLGCLLSSQGKRQASSISVSLGRPSQTSGSTFVREQQRSNCTKGHANSLGGAHLCPRQAGLHLSCLPEIETDSYILPTHCRERCFQLQGTVLEMLCQIKLVSRKMCHQVKQTSSHFTCEGVGMFGTSACATQQRLTNTHTHTEEVLSALTDGCPRGTLL